MNIVIYETWYGDQEGQKIEVPEGVDSYEKAEEYCKKLNEKTGGYLYLWTVTGLDCYFVKSKDYEYFTRK